MKQVFRYTAAAIFSLFTITQFSCAQSQTTNTKKVKKDMGVIPVAAVAPVGKAVAVFAEGCFWCSEHIFEAVVGVDSAISGYAGGDTKNPTYESVSSETTGHAESVMVYYDPKIITYDELLNVFFTSQDPTTPNQQGPDRGSSYRSGIFYTTDAEKLAAEAAIAKYNASGMFANKIVTEVKKLDVFYRAEEYHQDYVLKNPNSNSYVQNVSLPRFELFKKTYKGKLK